MKTYLLNIRRYSICANDYVLCVYKVVTDNIYRVIGKIYCSSLEKIERIDYSLWTVERETFWKENGYEIFNYVEPHLSEDN